MRIFSLDPGKTSGWCFIDEDRGVISHGTIPLEWLPKALLCDTAETCRRLRSADRVIYENFHIRPHQARTQDVAVPAREGIGVLRAACYVHGLSPDAVPAGGKSAGRMWISERLPQVEALRKALRSEHERDAMDLIGAELRNIYLAERSAR